MLVAHHRSAFRFVSRSSDGWHRLALPLVVLVLAVRFTVAGARQALGTLHRKTRRGD
jgi:hypothetical protein